MESNESYFKFIDYYNQTHKEKIKLLGESNNLNVICYEFKKFKFNDEFDVDIGNVITLGKKIKMQHIFYLDSTKFIEYLLKINKIDYKKINDKLLFNKFYLTKNKQLRTLFLYYSDDLLFNINETNDNIVEFEYNNELCLDATFRVYYIDSFKDVIENEDLIFERAKLIFERYLSKGIFR